MEYCKNCQRLVEGPICKFCRNTKLRAPLDADFCMVAELPYFEAEMLKELFGDVVTLRSYDSLDNLKLDIAAERVDGGLADYFTWRDFLETPEGHAAVFFGPQVNGGLWGPGVGAGMHKDDTDLIARFDNAIAAAVEDGTIKALSQKWFKTDISPASTK